MEFSHHTSNPLEARASDPLNTGYCRLYQEATSRRVDLSSEDELGRWGPEQEEYQEHIKELIKTTHKFNDATPKAGPSRSRATFTPMANMFIDLDEDMSDDELSQPFVEDRPRTIDPRKEFKIESEEQTYVKEEEKKEVYAEEEDEGEHDSHAREDEDIIPLVYDQEEFIFIDDPDDPHEVRQEQYQDDDYPDTYLLLDEDEEMHEDDDNGAQRPNSRLSSLSPLTPISSAHSSPYSSPQSSRPSSPDESLTLTTRSQDEQDEILHEIEQLYKSVPELEGNYELVDRLGTGTFSSVYKAIDLIYDEWDNQPWMGHHPPESSAYYQSAAPGFRGRGGRATRRRLMNGDAEMEEGDHLYQPKDGRVYVAIKRIYTTSGPERVRNELSIMETCRGCRHSSQIITAFRDMDQVVIVLPYQRNMDFRDFYQSLHPEGIKCYFRCLFRALRDIHSRGIIHRDVKPANFLYNPFTGIGTLCDFGLASRMEVGPHIGQCLHTHATPRDPHGKNHQLDEYQTMQVKRAQREARAKSTMPAEKVGYPENDRRPVSKANRAGTRGFRAPEVLLKCGAQTGAIDVWSAGIILLFFLTGKFPIFQSNDDIEGLMEIAAIIGKKKIERAATLHGRTIATNVPDLDQEGLTWQEFVEKLNPTIREPRKYDMRFYPHNSKHRDGQGSAMPPPPVPPSAINATSSPFTAHDGNHQHSDRYANPPTLERLNKDMRTAFHFLESVLHFESTKRMTPRQALYHPFLAEPGVEGDDAFVPHMYGDGVCGELHSRDEVTERNLVKIFRKCLCLRLGQEDGEGEADGEGEGEADGEGEGEGGGKERWCGEYVEDIVEVAAGEGIAIGDNPCDFHPDFPYY